MKKLFIILLVLSLMAGVAACSGGNDDSNTPSSSTTPSASTTPPPTSSEPTTPETTAPSESSGDAVNAESYSGYGVYEFGVYRYEGEWQNGKPNGTGTMFNSSNAGNGEILALTGNYADGLSSGSMIYTSNRDGGIYEHYSFDTQMGDVVQNEVLSNRGNSLWKDDVKGMEPWARNGWTDHIVTVSDLDSTTPPDTSTPGTSGDSFFPGIDDSLLPDDVVKIIVGTVSVVQSRNNYIELHYDGITRADFDTLLAHYSATSTKTDIDNGNNDQMARAICLYNWGEIYLLYDGSLTPPVIKVNISINQ